MDISQKKLIKCSKCAECDSLIAANKNEEISHNNYLTLLSRGGFTIPSQKLADFTSTCLAVLDYADSAIEKEDEIPARLTAEYVLRRCCPNVEFACNAHIDWGFIFATKIIVNIFFNNKQKVTNARVRKDDVIQFKRNQRKILILIYH